MKSQEVVCWPESQDLFVLNGFADNCSLINGERGLDTYGSSAYVVNMEWLKDAKPLAEEPDDYDAFEDGLRVVYDDELEELGLL